MNKPFFGKSITAVGLCCLILIVSMPAASAFGLIFEDGSMAGPQKVTLTELGGETINQTYNTTSTITDLDPEQSLTLSGYPRWPGQITCETLRLSSMT